MDVSLQHLRTATFKSVEVQTDSLRVEQLTDLDSIEGVLKSLAKTDFFRGLLESFDKLAADKTPQRLMPTIEVFLFH